MTIPNILSFFRIFLIPVFIFTFIFSPHTAVNWIPLIVLIVSGITDLLDGYIARKYNQTSDLGKMLDPVADKLTQIAVCACLTITYPQLLVLLVIYIIKELAMLTGGVIQLKYGKTVPSAKWYGKVSTAELYLAMGIFLIVPNMPDIYVNIIIIITVAMVLFALVMYMTKFIELLIKKGKTNDLQQM